MLQTSGFLSPDFVPVVLAFLVSIERGCAEVGCFFVDETAIRSLIHDLGRCVEDSEAWESETYCAEQHAAFSSTRMERIGGLH
jgi:hypothetical protein